MTRHGRSALGAEAAANIPTGDPDSVSMTSLPFLKARQDRNQNWFAARADRFSQLIGGSVRSEIEGDRIHQSGALTPEEREELLQLRAQAAIDVRAEISTHLTELRALLMAEEPLGILAYLSQKHVLALAGDYYEPAHEGSELAVEVAVGLCLTQEPPTNPSPATGHHVLLIDENLEELEQLCVLSIAANMDPDDPNSQMRASALTQWMKVRGEAYVDHSRDLARSLYGTVPQWMQETFGFTIEDFLGFSEALFNYVEASLNSAIGAIINRMNAVAPPTAKPDDLDPVVFMALLDEMSTSASESLILTRADIYGCVDLEREVVDALLSALSMELGSVDPGDYWGPFDPSPLARHPLVEHSGRFLLPVPGHLVRAPHKIFDGPLHTAHKRYTRHRAAVIDEHTMGLLRTALPGAVADTNLYYRFDDGDGERQYETDGLLLFEDHCLVVEGKAQNLSVAAQRGDLVRLSRDMRDHLSKAWTQCSRLSHYLESCEEAVFTDDRGRIKFRVDTANIVHTRYINPTLYPLGAYAYQLPALASLGMFPAGASPWPVLVTDLRVVVEMLRSPAELLHYLEWRSSLQIGEKSFAMDELDIWLFGFQRGVTEASRSQLGLPA